MNGDGFLLYVIAQHVLLLLPNLLPLIGIFLYAACTPLLTLFFLAWEYQIFARE
jgi:uncharacterized protein involved in cysteine biosynthesis